MELPKLLEKWQRKEISPWENALVRWLLLLEGSENREIYKTLEEIAVQDPILQQAIAAWEQSSDDPKVREEYFARRKALLDEKAAVREAELRLKEAIQEGERNKAEGIAKVARNLLDLGVEISKVSRSTGLSEKEIKMLKNR